MHCGIFKCIGFELQSKASGQCPITNQMCITEIIVSALFFYCTRVLFTQEVKCRALLVLIAIIIIIKVKF